MSRSIPVLIGVAVLSGFASEAPAAPMGPPGAPPPPDGAFRHSPPPTNEERAGRLKALLQLSPAQDAAADAFIVATAPPDLEDLPAPARLKAQALSTPERLDHMEAMRKERDAQMAKIGAATRTFYSALTPSQKTAFDALPAPVALGFAGPMGPMPPMMGRPVP